MAAVQALEQCLQNGKAAEIFARMVTAHGGPVDLIDKPRQHLKLAPVTAKVVAQTDGVVAAYDTRAVGMAVVALGGGRRRASDVIDFAVGAGEFVELGAAVRAGDTLAVVYAVDEAAATRAVQEIQSAIDIGGDAITFDSVMEEVR